MTHPVETFHRLSHANLLAAAAAARRAVPVGARVRHATRGPGVVVELMADGRTRIAFDSGEVHRYWPRSMHKIEPEPGYSASEEREPRARGPEREPRERGPEWEPPQAARYDGALDGTPVRYDAWSASQEDPWWSREVA